MPNSVKSALMGGGTRAQGQANMLKGTKGMAKGGGMKKGTKYKWGADEQNAFNEIKLLD